MSLDEHAQITDAKMTVGVLRLGSLSDEAFGQYLALLRGLDRFSAAELRCATNLGQRQTPFSNRSRGEWAGGASPQIRLRWVESPRGVDRWADLQPSKEVVGIIGVCRSQDVANLTTVHAELQAAVGVHRFARHGDCYRLYVFDPPTDSTPADVGEAELPNVILIPTATARMTTADYLHRLLEDFVSEMVEKLDAWVLDLDGNMPVLQTALDSRSMEDSQLVAKRRSGRMSKYMGDCALMSGSPLDALELYAVAAQECNDGRDKLWYASALEGLCCAELIEHQLQQPPGKEREKPRPVEQVRERMIEALDIYSLSRLEILENECCLKFAQFLVDVYQHEGVRWVWLMDSIRWAVDFSEDLPIELQLRALEKIQSLYSGLGCRRKVAFFMQLRARLLSEELGQHDVAGAIYFDLISHYVHASDAECAKSTHRRCLAQRIPDCNWPALEQCLYSWLSEVAKQNGNPTASASWDLRALASPALLSRQRATKLVQSEMQSVTSKLAIAEAEGTTLGRGRQEDIDRLKSQVASLQTSLDASHEQATEQAAMAEAVMHGFASFPPSCQGRDARPQILVRVDALDLPSAARPVSLRNTKTDHGPFLYSSFMARDAAKKRKPILWASGEVATVLVQLQNPLSIPIDVVDATLIVSDPLFDASPQSFTLEAGATRSLWLNGVCSMGTSDGGGEPLFHKVLGITMTVFGVVHEYPIDADGRYMHLDGFPGTDATTEAEPDSDPTRSKPTSGDTRSHGLDITVVPAMPKLVARLHGCEVRGEIVLQVGEKKQLQLFLANTSSRCAASSITITQRALRLDGSLLYQTKTKKQMAAEGRVENPDPVSWTDADLAAVTPLPAGQTAMIPLQLHGLPGCAAVGLTLAYAGGAEASYGRELRLMGLRLKLRNDGCTANVESATTEDLRGPGAFRCELVAVHREHGSGEGEPQATHSTAETLRVPLVEQLSGEEAPCSPARWQWQISTFKFFELRLCVGISPPPAGEIHADGGRRNAVPTMSVHLDATGIDGCSYSGAFDYNIDEQWPMGDKSDNDDNAEHIHSIGLFFTKPTLAEMKIGVTDHSTGQLKSHQCHIAVS